MLFHEKLTGMLLVICRVLRRHGVRWGAGVSVVVVVAGAITGCCSDEEGRLVGWVQDTDGNTLPYVKVQCSDEVAYTDGAGLYCFEKAPAGEELVVQFLLEGYIPVSSRVRVAANGSATLNVTLKRLEGGVVLANPAGGGQAGGGVAQLNLPANALGPVGKAGSGSAVIHVTAVDLGSGGDTSAFPGGFSSSGGGMVEAYAAADFRVFGGSMPMALAAGATASIRLRLVAGTQAHVGDTFPLWYFDAAAGWWVQRGEGTVVGGSAAGWIVEGSVNALGWWCCGVPLTGMHLIRGTAYDAEGAPVVNALIAAVGEDYHGAAYTRSGPEGAYELEVKPGARVRLEMVLPGAYFIGAQRVLTAGAAGEATEGQDLAPDYGSCVYGVVTEPDGVTPVSGERVYSSVGGSVVTGEDGGFCFAAPGGVYTAVYVLGRPPVFTVTPSTASCAGGDGAEVAIFADYPRDGDRVGFIFGTLTTTEIPFWGVRKDMGSMALFYSGVRGDQFDPYDADAPLDTFQVYTGEAEAGADWNVNFSLLSGDAAFEMLFHLGFGVNELMGLAAGEAPSIEKIGALDAGSPGSVSNGEVSVPMRRPLDYYYGFEGSSPLEDLGYAVLTPWMGGFFFQEGFLARGFNPGETLTYSWPGGVDLGPFSAQGVVPGRLVITAPSTLYNLFAGDVLTSGLDVQWESEGAGDYVTILLETIVLETSSAPLRAGIVVCKADDDGSYLIPPAALGQLPQPSGHLAVQINYLFAKRHTVTETAVPLARENGQGYAVLTLGTEPVRLWGLNAHVQWP